MARQRAEFGSREETGFRDRRLDAPAFHRNNGVIGQRLSELLEGRRGNVLELGSGTGQHCAAFARALPKLTWWPSDIDPKHLASIDAWARYSGLANLRPAARLDAAAWPWAPEPPGIPLGDGLEAVLSINVVHIAPWETAQGIFRGAGCHLKAGGWLVFYGPFKRDGGHTAPSNAAFDEHLRASNPAWGVRDMADMAAAAESHALALVDTRPVPANNFILTFEKRR